MQQEEPKKPAAKASRQHAFKGKDAKQRDENADQPKVNDNQAPAEEDASAKPSVAPKPFLKRKTKTMQPAKINWKTKSRIDCWGDQSKSNNKKEVISPPQKLPPPEKSLLQAQ